MKKTIFTILVLLSLIIAPKALAAGGIYATGGGTKTVGQNFTITVAASGADLDSLQGTISVSGPVDIVSFSAGGATWLPGKSPANGREFVGIVSPTSSTTVATIKIRGKSVGSGSVSVSGVKLARNGVITGTGAGSTNFTLERALQPPGAPTVTSTSHPDQNTFYEATTVSLTWEKASNVTGFSYLLDQAEGTTPPAKTTSGDTTVSYANQAIGTYYFHIRAQNGDGWGGTTHFKINIKEPDAKIDDTLNKPHDIAVKKAAAFTNNVADGLFTGIIISGTTEPNFMTNIKLAPMPTLPENKLLSVQADATGHFEYTIDFPITAGFYKLTVQGQDNKTLTPESDAVPFEISQAKGGTVTMLTKSDETEPVIPPKKWNEKIDWMKIAIVSTSALILAIMAITFVVIRIRKRKLK